MFENIAKFFKKLVKSEQPETKSKDTAKERLHLVLMQDRANVSADFLELMKQEIIEVIKKYIEVDDKAIDVRLTNKVEEDGTNGSPFLYANIPIVKVKNELKPQNSDGDKEKTDEQSSKKETDNNKKDNVEKIEEDQSKEDNVNGEEKKENKEKQETEKSDKKADKTNDIKVVEKKEENNKTKK